MLKTNKKENFFKKPENRISFFTRLISSIVLITLMAVYIALARYHSFNTGATSGKIAGYFNLAITIGLFLACAYEIVKTFNVKGKEQILLIFFLTILMYFPLSFNTSLDYPIFNKDFFLKKIESWDKNLRSLFFPLIWICIFLIASFAGYKAVKKNNQPQDVKRYFGLYLTYTIIIVFGFKSLLSFLLSPHVTYSGTLTLVWVWFMIISADSFAYLGGILFGKHKLTSISPKKTVEGALIGFVLAFVIGLIVALVPLLVKWDDKNSIDYRMFGNMLGASSKASASILLVLICFIVPIISMFGDIAFSYIKRVFDIKDFSNIIPGHGGALDRLDSLLVTLFVLYLIILFVSPVRV